MPKKSLLIFLYILEIFVGIFAGMAIFGSVFIYLSFSYLNTFTSFVFALFCFCFFIFLSLMSQAMIFLLKK